MYSADGTYLLLHQFARKSQVLKLARKSPNGLIKQEVEVNTSKYKTKICSVQTGSNKKDQNIYKEGRGCRCLWTKHLKKHLEMKRKINCQINKNPKEGAKRNESSWLLLLMGAPFACLWQTFGCRKLPEFESLRE